MTLYFECRIGGFANCFLSVVKQAIVFFSWKKLNFIAISHSSLSLLLTGPCGADLRTGNPRHSTLDREMSHRPPVLRKTQRLVSV